MPWRPAVECARCTCGEAHIVILRNVTIVGRTVEDGLMQGDCSRVEEVGIPGHVQAIGTMAFSEASNLRAVNMARHGVLRRIEDYAFQGCSRLASVAS